MHVSEMDWTNKNVNPAKVVHTGQEVEVMVLDVDEERRRISLGLKQCKANPWKEFAENHNRGDKVAGSDQVDHRLRHLHRPAGQHRRPGAPVRHLLGPAGRRGGAQLPESPAGRSHGAVDRSGARAHIARHQAARQGPVLGLHRREPQGQIVRAWSRKSTRAARSSISAMASMDSCAPTSYGRDRVEDARAVLKVGDQVEAKFIGVDRKSAPSRCPSRPRRRMRRPRRYRATVRRPTSGTSLGSCSKNRRTTR